jgi:hypothetical protein
MKNNLKLRVNFTIKYFVFQRIILTCFSFLIIPLEKWRQNGNDGGFHELQSKLCLTLFH